MNYSNHKNGFSPRERAVESEGTQSINSDLSGADQRVLF